MQTKSSAQIRGQYLKITVIQERKTHGRCLNITEIYSEIWMKYPINKTPIQTFLPCVSLQNNGAYSFHGFNTIRRDDSNRKNSQPQRKNDIAKNTDKKVESRSAKNVKFATILTENSLFLQKWITRRSFYKVKIQKRWE